MHFDKHGAVKLTCYKTKPKHSNKLSSIK